MAQAKYIYEALEQGQDLLAKYKELVLVQSPAIPYPPGMMIGFRNFCLNNRFRFRVIPEVDPGMTLMPGEAYIVIEETDLVNLVKISRAAGQIIGRDIGIISYNDTPLKEILLEGITVISTDHAQMGETAARMILLSKALPLGRFLLGGLLTGIIGAVIVLVYNVLYRRESDFYTYEVVMPLTIFMVCPLFELLCGGAYYLFAGHLRSARPAFTSIFVVLTIAIAIGTSLIDNSHREMTLRDFRGLLVGIEVILGMLGAFLIPFFVHHPRMYMSSPGEQI